MEVSGIVSRLFHGGGFNPYDSKSDLFIKTRCFGEINLVGVKKSEDGSGKSRRKCLRVVSNGFCDKGHMEYYNYKGKSIVCDGKKKEKKIKESMKKLKLLRGLGKDSLGFSQMGLGDDDVVTSGDLLVGENQEEKLLVAADVLMKKLEMLKAEKEKLKRLRKAEKAKLKAERRNVMMDSESSSSSSESSDSSDSECDETVDMNQLRTEASAQPCCEGTSLANSSTEIGFLPKVEDSTVYNVSCSSVSSAEHDVKASCAVSMKKIEVCMGNKCSKSGAAALLAEFERAVGPDGEVVGCKCMGKCRDGPNVRLVNLVNEVQGMGENDSVRLPGNPLCIGVNLEDVDVIVSNFLAKSTKDSGLTAAV